MSRTYREGRQGRRGNRICVETITVREDDEYTYTFVDWNWQSVHLNGWRHAKETLPAEEYKDACRRRGDCITKDYLCGSLPKYVRRRSTKVVRQHWKEEKHKFLNNPNHEIMVVENLRFDFNYW